MPENFKWKGKLAASLLALERQQLPGLLVDQAAGLSASPKLSQPAGSEILCPILSFQAKPKNSGVPVHPEARASHPLNPFKGGPGFSFNPQIPKSDGSQFGQPKTDNR
jgi:hypothetical protein